MNSSVPSLTTTMDLKVAVVLAILAISCVSADHFIPWRKLWPVDKEVVYRYKGLVKAGTDVPHSFSSQFLLDGYLHLQMLSDYELMVRFDKLQYQLDNGRESEHRTMTKKPSEMDSMTKPFKIIYEVSGIVKEIIVDENEPEPTLNMKKAIAAMLQVNWEKVIFKSVKPHAFTSMEKSIFGMDETLYTVMPENEILKVYRMHDKASTGHIYKNLITNARPMKCDASFEEPVAHDSQKLYVLDRKDPAQMLLKYVETNGGVYYHPYQAQSTAYYIFVNQTMEYMEMKDTVPLTMTTQHKYTSLEYEFVEHCITFEHVDNPRSLVPELKIMLNEMVEYMAEDKILPTLPDIKKGQLVNRMVTVLSHFDMATFEEVYEYLTSKTEQKDLLKLEIYQELLPLIGTKNSFKFILKLVKEKPIKETVALELIRQMPFMVKLPTVQLIQDMEEMLHLSKPYPVQKAAILSFATLLSKLYTYNEQHHIQETAFFEKYMKVFIEKVKVSEKLEDKYLYLDALYNMNNPLTISYLEPLVKGEWFNDVKLRFKGMMSISNVLIRNPEKMFELIMPIFIDKHLPTYLRIHAYYFMMRSQPSLAQQINMAYFMNQEKDIDLLNFYYTHLKSLAESKNPCLYKSKIQAKQLLLYWPTYYKHSLTQFQKFDLTNWKYNYGQTHDFMFMNTNDALVFTWKKEINVMNLVANPSTFYVKITGLDKALFQDLYINTKTGMRLTNFDKLYERLLDSPKKDKFQMEIIHGSYGQIVENIVVDKDSIYKVLPVLKLFFSDSLTLNKKELHIHYDMFIKMHVPTDIGFVAVVELLMPSVHETKTSLTKKIINNIINVNIDNHYDTEAYYSYGLRFHNPFASVWQGVSRYMNLDETYPIYLDLAINPDQKSLKMSWKHREDKVKNVIGFRSYVATYVYIRDYLNKNILQSINPDALNFVLVGHDSSYKHNVTVTDYEDYNTRHNYKVTVFNDENPKYSQVFKMYHDFFTKTTGTFAENLMQFILYKRYLQHQHDVVERGITFRVEPSVESPVTSIELTMRLNYELPEQGVFVQQPAMKVNSRATYVLKNKEQPLKTWDVVAVLDLNGGHTVNALKLEISRLIPGQKDYKICVQGSETYTEYELNGKMKISMSHPEDGKCKDDETVIRIAMKAEQLPEQKRGINNYDVCHHPVRQLIKDLRSYECYSDRLSLRYYTVDIKYAHLPTEFKKIILGYFRELLTEYEDNYIHDDSVTEGITEGNLKVQLRYPVSKNTIDMKFTTPTDIYKFKGLPAQNFHGYGLYPDNLYYGNMNKFLHDFGLTYVCTIKAKEMGDDFTLILGDKEESPKYGVFGKLLGGKMILKVVLPQHTLLITPVGHKYTITLDEKELQFDHTMHNKLFMLTKMEDSNTVVYMGKYSGAQLVFNGEELLLEGPKTDVLTFGKCLQKIIK